MVRAKRTAASQKDLGNAAYKDGKFTEAIKMYEQGITLCQAEDTEICCTLHSNCAMCHYQERNYDLCINHCNRALEANPNHVKSLLRRALAYEANEKLSSALSDFRAAYGLDPGLRQAYDGISRVQRAKKLRDKSILDEKNGVDPRKTTTAAMTTVERAQKVIEFKTQGNSFFQAGRNQEAIVWYSKGIDLDDRNQALYSNRSASYLNLGEFEKALHDADRVTEIKADWPKGWYRKGAAHMKLGQHMQASVALRKALELDPTNQTIVGMLAEAQSKV